MRQEPLIGIKVAAATVSLSEAKPNVSLKLPQAAVSLSEAPPCSSEAVRLSQAKPGGSFKAGEALPVRLRSQATGSLRLPQKKRKRIAAAGPKKSEAAPQLTSTTHYSLLIIH